MFKNLLTRRRGNKREKEREKEKGERGRARFLPYRNLYYIYTPIYIYICITHIYVYIYLHHMPYIFCSSSFALTIRYVIEITEFECMGVARMRGSEREKE